MNKETNYLKPSKADILIWIGVGLMAMLLFSAELIGDFLTKAIVSFLGK